jgi:hypothetical protein
LPLAKPGAFRTGPENANPVRPVAASVGVDLIPHDVQQNQSAQRGDRAAVDRNVARRSGALVEGKGDQNGLLAALIRLFGIRGDLPVEPVLLLGQCAPCGFHALVPVMRWLVGRVLGKLGAIFRVL